MICMHDKSVKRTSSSDAKLFEVSWILICIGDVLVDGFSGRVKLQLIFYAFDFFVYIVAEIVYEHIIKQCHVVINTHVINKL